MNEHEAQRIADAISHARPDWPAASIRTLLARPALATRPRRDVFVALAWVASEAETRNPGRVLEDGPWWRAAAADATDTSTALRNPFDPATACDTCSQPEHRHTSTSGHDYVSVHDANRRRDNAPKPPLPRPRQGEPA